MRALCIRVHPGHAAAVCAVVPAAIFATVALTRRQAPTVTITAGMALALLTAVAGLAWTG